MGEDDVKLAKLEKSPSSIPCTAAIRSSVLAVVPGVVPPLCAALLDVDKVPTLPPAGTITAPDPPGRLIEVVEPLCYSS
jgi:hypothetical protein